MSKDESEAVRAGASSKEIRQARVKRLLRRIAIWVVIPTFLGIIYYGLMAASQYDSVAIIRVQSKGGGKSKANALDAKLLKEYAESRAMLDYLVQQQKFDAHYKDGGDIVSSLSSGASSEDLYEYFRDMVHVDYQEASGSLKVTVRAFSGESAQTFGRSILEAAETMTNATDEVARAARNSLVNDRIEETEKTLVSAQGALSALEAEALLETPPTPNTETTTRLAMALYKRDLARSGYEKAVAARVKLEADLVREQLYIAIVSPPSAPSGAVHPRRVWGMLTVFVLSFVLMGVFGMLGAALKEHARF